MPFRKNTGRPKERLTFCKGAEIRNAGKEGKKKKRPTSRGNIETLKRSL